MAYVIAAPEMMMAATTDLAAIGSNVDAAHMVAAARTTAVTPAAADEVSTAIAQVFSQHAMTYQAAAGQAAAFSDQFVQALKAGGAAYALDEAINAASLQLQIAFFSLLPLVIQNGLAVYSVLPPVIQNVLANLGIAIFFLIVGLILAYFVLAILSGAVFNGS
ncbi:PE family protein [Mycobacterium sp. UM_CSW]|uniref:PE family protein n=1 Tax=Mycobacterium sp. UM_CSW TaxID=1370119 RepID=UPI0003F81339|nr:PE family protein [Mycobacterium sp. UM_CSW]